MTLHPWAKKSLVMGSGFLFLAVAIGAFGAHGLKSIVTPEKLVTFETGVRYHFYHGFALLFLGLIQQNFQNLNSKASLYAFAVGIVLFSFNCYFYAVTGMKFFAMLVPLGGALFLVGWFYLFWQALKLR